MSIRRVVLGTALLLTPALAHGQTPRVSWTRNLPGCSPQASALADDGTLYLACADFDTDDIRVVALDAGGRVVAEAHFGGNAGPGSARPTALVLDEARGRVLLAGHTTLTDDSDETRGVVASFARAGLVPRWTKHFEDSWPVFALALGPDGSVYGVTREGPGDESVAELFRLDGAGVQLFRTLAPAGEPTAAGFESLVVAADGSAYAAVNGTVVGFDARGALVWTVVAQALTVALRPDGNVLATTPLMPTGSTVLISPQGQVLFRADVGGMYVTTNAENEAWVLGTDYETSQDSDWVLSRLDARGNVRWTVRYGDVRQDTATGLALDVDDNAYVTGMATVRGGLFNLFYSLRARLVKLAASGQQVWQTDVPATSSPSAVHVDADLTLRVPGLEATSAFE